MCSNITERFSVRGSGKGRPAWFHLTEAVVYYDHPVHASGEHTLNIDFRDPTAGPAGRVAVELDALSARALAHGILKTLDAASLAAGDMEAVEGLSIL